MFNQQLNEWLNKFKIPIALSLVGVVLIVGGILLSGVNQKKAAFPKESIIEAQKFISVDVSGAVKNPAVYQLNYGKRIEDAITAAGGLTEEANGEFISKNLNLAMKLTDGMKIYIPRKGESTPVSGVIGGGSVAGTQIQGKVNINTASQAELEALSGVGPVTAAKIISGRPYTKIEDLITIKAVNKSTFEKIKDSISVY